MNTNPRLSSDEINRVRTQHTIGDVLRRAGIELPGGAGGDFMISCPTTGHDDTTPSCMIHDGSGRFYCFGCGAHGDVFALVREVAGVSSLAQIADLLDAGGPLSWRSAPSVPRVTPVRTIGTDLPALDRTPVQRILDVNNVAWRYLSSARLADQARAHLARRGIDVWQLESQSGTQLAGYTPADYRGLSGHLHRCGFNADEIVDAGWSSRRDGGLVDRFHRRVLFPVRHPDGGIAGVIGRDVTDHARQKYLNTARTAAYRKGELLYQPLAGKPHDARVLVCEGPLDALAIASADAASALRLLPVAPSGTALTSHQAQRIAALSEWTPLVCADGDPAGAAASAKWQNTLRAAGTRPKLVTLPDGHDPASYLQTHGPSALGTLIAHALVGQERDLGRGSGIPA
jgi:DNA primase